MLDLPKRPESEAVPLTPEENTFETLMVDLTHRCNMHCTNCYLPDRTPPDMDAEKLIEALSRLPGRTNIRLAGGEPTLRRDLPDIISRIRALGHRVVVLTNGLRLADPGYVDELRGAGLRHVYISLNGADNDDWYVRIDGMRCAAKKLRAVENVLDARMVLNTGTILVRGVNEAAMARMLAIISGYAPRHALLRFKNIGAIGRYDEVGEAENITMAEMEALAATATGQELTEVRAANKIKGRAETNTRLFPVVPGMRRGQGLWIKITNWQADSAGRVDQGSPRRGLLRGTMRIDRFFEWRS